MNRAYFWMLYLCALIVQSRFQLPRCLMGLRKYWGRCFATVSEVSHCVYIFICSPHRPQSAQIRCTWMNACKADDCFSFIHSWKSGGRRTYVVCVYSKRVRYFKNAIAHYWRKCIFSNAKWIQRVLLTIRCHGLWISQPFSYSPHANVTLNKTWLPS